MSEVYTKLPAPSDPSGEHAAYHLRHIVEEELNVVYVLLAVDDQDVERMRDLARKIAERKPGTRRVVEIAADHLDDDLRKKVKGSRSTWPAAAVFGFDDQVTKRLSRAQALRKGDVYLAFTTGA